MLKHHAFILSLLLLFLYSANCTTTNNTGQTADFNKIGIVTASTLNSRSNPDINSKVIKTYSFGTPLHLTDKTVSAGNNSDIWYKDRYSNGWVSGKYLVITENRNISLLKGSLILCHISCGGSCFSGPDDMYLVDNHYIEIINNYDYYPEDTNPCSVVIIGKYRHDNGNIIFSNAEYISGYTAKGDKCRHTWIKNVKSVLPDYLHERYFTKHNYTLYYRKDTQGEFYTIGNEKLLPRDQYKSVCEKLELTDKDRLKDGIRIDYYQKQEKSIKELHDIYNSVF